MKVAVLGGGIAGLTAAYRLAQAKVQTTLLEASDRLGGLGTWFEYQGLELDRFYHVMLDSDSHLLKLIDEVGLTDRLHWAETKMGFFVRGKSYGFNTPMDLLRFGALRFRDRIRTGLGAMYITKGVKEGKPLDDVLAHEWLRKIFGKRVCECIWDSLLNAKFGDLRTRVPAYWVWASLNREKHGGKEVKCYVKGGYPLITQRLQGAIEAAGGTVRLNSAVKGIEETPEGIRLHLTGGAEEFDALISTVPLPQLHGLAINGLAERIPLPDLSYQGVVNVLLVLRERLDQYYWTAVVNSDFPFQGIVETTHVIPPEWLGGRHLVYLMNYCSADHPRYAVPDDQLRSEAAAGLRKLYPHFDPARIEASFVFRTPYVEPVWTLGYLRKRPAAHIGGTRIHLATTAQAYPMVTAWNTSVKLAEDAVASVLSGVPGNRSAASPALTR